MEDNNKNANINANVQSGGNDTSETHQGNATNHLHSLGFETSESSTTNIPPRLPMGYSYVTPQSSHSEDNHNSPTPTTETTTQHPDLPKENTPLRSSDEGEERSVTLRKPRKRNAKTKRLLKRIALCILFIILLLTAALTYPYWSKNLGSWNHNEPTPATAADTLPEIIKPTPIDTTATALSPEDSLRIQDSIRHARWLYWQRHKKDKEAQEEVHTESDNETAMSTPNEHTTTHSDTLR